MTAVRLAAGLAALVLYGCAVSPDLKQAIETGPAAFVPPDHPAILAAKGAALEQANLIQILTSR